MALEEKKQRSFIDKTNTNSKFFITGSKITEMSASFAQADHIQASHYFEENKALLYQLDQMQEEIDEIRRYITNEATGSAVKSIKDVNVSNLPTSALGLSIGQLYVLTEKDKTKTIKTA